MSVSAERAGVEQVQEQVAPSAAESEEGLGAAVNFLDSGPHVSLDDGTCLVCACQ